jgi:hypothetical protein
MSKADSGHIMPEDTTKPSRRTVLARGPQVGLALGALLTVPSTAMASETPVAQLYKEYLTALTDMKDHIEQSRQAHRRCQEISSDPPASILQPIPGMTRSIGRHYASTPPGRSLRDSDVIYYRSSELKAVLLRSDVPNYVRETAIGLLPLVESFEASEAAASEASGYVKFTDEAANVFYNRVYKAEAAVIDELPQNAGDLIYKAIVLKRILEEAGDCDEESEKLCNQLIAFFTGRTA